MTKKEIQEYIVNGLLDKLSKYDFIITKVSYRGERYAEFEYAKGDAVYKWLISFVNYGKVEVSLLVYYDCISKQYKQLSQEINGGSNFVFAYRMNTYLHPQNADGYHNTSDYLEIPYKDDINEGRNLDSVVEYVYQSYFLDCVPRIIAQTDTIKKANELLNKMPFEFDSDGDPKMLVYSNSLVDQMLNGILIAQQNNSSNYVQIKEVYLECANRLDNGKNVPIALLREAIEKFEIKT